MSIATRHLVRATVPVLLGVAIIVPGRGSAAPYDESAENGRIAFSTAALVPHPDRETPSQVYSLNSDGSDLRQLTHVRKGAQAGDPDWSPDGSKIVYTSNASGEYAPWVMNADGTDQHRIAGKAGWEYFTPRWSPDGTRLAVVACDRTLGFELYCDIVLMDEYGNHQRLLVGGHRLNGDPDWSPDGSMVAFDSDRGGLVSAVWVVNTKGRPHPQRLTKPSLEAFWPQWAPGDDAETILFSSVCCADAPTDLYTINVSSKAITQVTQTPEGEFAALGTYSPDGKQIVFVSNHELGDGEAALFTMNADGSGDWTPIMTDHPSVFASDWGTATSTDDSIAKHLKGIQEMRTSHVTVAVLAGALLTAAMGASPTAAGRTRPAVQDGRIAFRDGLTGQIYTANPDGSALQQVTHLGKKSFAADPQWSPDASHITAPIFGPKGALVYEMKADGSDLHVVFKDDPGWFDVTSSYTPDGGTIVFSRCQEFCAIYSIHVDGAGLTQLTRYRKGIHAGADFHPQVSPDGNRIMFVRQQSNGILSQIWLMNMDGSGAHPITKPGLQAGGRPVWSSDGSLIYFEAPAAGFGSHLYSVTAAGDNVTELTFTPYPNGDFDSSNSPTGTRLSFTSDRRYSDPTNVSDLFVMKSDGSDQHYIHTGLTLVLDTDWGTAPLQSGPSVKLPAWASHPSPALRARAAARAQLLNQWTAPAQWRGGPAR